MKLNVSGPSKLEIMQALFNPQHELSNVPPVIPRPLIFQLEREFVPNHGLEIVIIIDQVLRLDKVGDDFILIGGIFRYGHNEWLNWAERGVRITYSTKTKTGLLMMDLRH